MRIQTVARADLDLDRLVQQHPVGTARCVCEGRRLTGEHRLELALTTTMLVELLLTEPQRLGELELTGSPFDAIAEPLGKVRRERRPLTPADQPVEGAPLWIGELHVSMVCKRTDMAETPDEILRALADPERLAIAGALALGDRSAGELSGAIDVPLARVRKHLSRLTSTGVVRVNDDRHTYRLDPETLRWAAEQVGPPRDAGLALGAANDDEEAVLRTFFRNGRLAEIPAKESKRRIVLERVALEFEPGERYDEKEVNVIVGRFHNDYAALRRYLVDEGFLDREGGVYWRAGGRVDL